MKNADKKNEFRELFFMLTALKSRLILLFFFTFLFLSVFSLAHVADEADITYSPVGMEVNHFTEADNPAPLDVVMINRCQTMRLISKVDSNHNNRVLRRALLAVFRFCLASFEFSESRRVDFAESTTLFHFQDLICVTLPVRAGPCC